MGRGDARRTLGPVDVVFDLLATGMWIGHLVSWLPWPVLGAAIGLRIGTRRTPATADAAPA